MKQKHSVEQEKVNYLDMWPTIQMNLVWPSSVGMRNEAHCTMHNPRSRSVNISVWLRATPPHTSL